MSISSTSLSPVYAHYFITDNYFSHQTDLPKALYAVGYFTEMGIGCRRDPLQANACYVKAADQGDDRARQRLAIIREAETGAFGPPADGKKKSKAPETNGSKKEKGSEVNPGGPGGLEPVDRKGGGVIKKKRSRLGLVSEAANGESSKDGETQAGKTTGKKDEKECMVM